MRDYIIATSSTSDLPRTYLEAHDIPFISYTYTIGDKLYEDDCREESRAAVYAGMRRKFVIWRRSIGTKGTASTAAPAQKPVVTP